MPGAPRLVRARSSERPLAVDALVDLFPVDGDALRRIDADPHLIAFDPEDRDRHVVPDHYRLADSAREDKHNSPFSFYCSVIPVHRASARIAYSPSYSAGSFG